MAGINDNSWIKQSFLMPDDGLRRDAYVAALRIYSRADAKFTTTGIGGNWALNTPPGFTEYADIPAKGLYHRDHDLSQGTFYSDVIDDNAVLMHVRCGVPKFNNIVRWFSGFYRINAAALARTGKDTGGFFHTAGSVVGGLFTLPLAPVILVGKVMRFVLGRPSSKYYYLNPTMHAYWSTVSSLVNGTVAAMGMHQSKYTQTAPGMGQKDEFIDPPDSSVWGVMSRYYPDIFNTRGFIDVMAISTRTQRVAETFRDTLEYRLANLNNNEERYEIIRDIVDRNSVEKTRLDRRLVEKNLNESDGLAEYLEKFIESDLNSVDVLETGEDVLMSPQGSGEEEIERTHEAYDSVWDFKTARGRDAAEFVTFRVENPSTQSESFSNSTKESGLSSQINSLSSNARDARFNFADGNIDPTGVVSSLVKAAKDFVSGVSESINMAGLAMLGGNAFADIPEMWDNSSVDVNKFSCTIPLRCPYNHPISRIQNILLPLCSLLAMSAPLSTGPSSYTSPFLVQVFVRGRVHIRLGIVESLTVTRGAGDVGWSRDGHFLGADVNITFKDLSTVLHMPVGTTYDSGIISKTMQGLASLAEGVGAAEIAATLDQSSYADDTLYNDYLGVLAAVPLEDEINKVSKWVIKRRRAAIVNASMTSKAWITSYAGSGVIGDLLSAVHARGDRGRSMANNFGN